jgi:hypothetical protein
VAIVPVGSVPLFTFASDGSMAWLRTSGPKLLAVDPRTGVVLREVRLDPAPFGLTWHVERHGGLFVVRDDREIAAYDDSTGVRLWTRTSPTKVAIAGETEGGKHISVAPGPDGMIDVFETDLRVGSFETRVRVPGTMRWVGANGVLAEGMLFFATDQREVHAVRARDFAIVEQHAFEGGQILPPVVSAQGVHVAVVETRAAGAVTTIATLDRTTGALVSRQELPGAAYALTVRSSGLVVDVRRAKTDAPERIAFRPDAPHVRLVAPRHVDLGVMRELRELAAGEEAREQREREERERANVEILPPARQPPRRHASGAQLLPPAPEPETIEPPEASPREGILSLLVLLEARTAAL